LKSKSKSGDLKSFQIKIANQKIDFKSQFQIVWFHILLNTGCLIDTITSWSLANYGMQCLDYRLLVIRT